MWSLTAIMLNSNAGSNAGSFKIGAIANLDDNALRGDAADGSCKGKAGSGSETHGE